MKRAGTQNDVGLGFDGAAVETTRKVSRDLHKNQWSGHLNDGRDVNMGRGPTKGNDGSCHHAGYDRSGKKPPTAELKSVPAQGSVRDSINRGRQFRGQGGTTVKSPANPDRINAGAGPRKGNQQ
jgi:hypothetical protein